MKTKTKLKVFTIMSSDMHHHGNNPTHRWDVRYSRMIAILGAPATRRGVLDKVRELLEEIEFSSLVKTAVESNEITCPEEMEIFLISRLMGNSFEFDKSSPSVRLGMKQLAAEMCNYVADLLCHNAEAMMKKAKDLKPVKRKSKNEKAGE
jgi:hypothetical protein